VRPNARLVLGYYPLPDAEAVRIGRFLEFPSSPANAIDPCAGTGAALAAMTAASSARRYAIELDAHRAGEARKTCHEVIQGSAFDCHSLVESFSLLYLNPPYDFEVGEGKNSRMERLFLEHCFRWLKPGGVLVMIIPFNQIYECRGVLTAHFRDKAIYRLTDPESVRYKQAVVFGVRRTRQERDRLTDSSSQQGNTKLRDLTRNYSDIPSLLDIADRVFVLPASEAARLEYRGLPLDTIEDMLPKSAASLQARRVTHAEQVAFSGRPLTPLHAGHVALCAVSGLLNGCFGEGADRHVAFWEAVKVSDKTEEEGEKGEIVIREKERFSQRLTLLYTNGRFALLSEKGKENQIGERPPADGEARLCPADEGQHHPCNPAP
jgi:predicted RNA methylase